MKEQSVDRGDQRQLLSALTDGEVTSAEAGAACMAWRDDGSSRQTWATYQLIGDVLRSDDLASGSPQAQFMDRLRQRLADEPVVLAPQSAAQVASHGVRSSGGGAAPEFRDDAGSAQAPRSHAVRSRAWSGPLAVAASLVAILSGVLTIQDAGLDSMSASGRHAAATMAASDRNAAQGLAWGNTGTPMAQSFSAQASTPFVLTGTVQETPDLPGALQPTAVPSEAFAPASARTSDLVWMIR